MENIIILISVFLAGGIFGLLTGIVLGFFIARAKNNELAAQKIKEDFVNLANATLVEKQQKIQEQNAQTLEDKMKPVLERIKEFQKKVDDFNKTEIENNISLMKQFEYMEKNNRAITEETQKLTLALTKNQNVKGAYGEGLLEIILEKSGLREGVHYHKQYNTQNTDDKTIRPDIVVNLPNNKHLIIDSKFTLTSFIEMCSDDENKETCDKFKREVRARVDEISKKGYTQAQGLFQPDFVFIYVPLENSLAAIYQDKDLVQYSLNRNIIIVGTSSVLASIKLIDQLWAREKSNETVEKITQAGVSLYETFSAFCEDLKDLQNQFENIGAQFTKTLNRFTRNNPKNPSMFSQIEKLKEYGITTSKQIPGEFLEVSQANE